VRSRSAEKDKIQEQINGDSGYKKLVLDGAIAPPIIWCGTITNPPYGRPSKFFLEEINNIVPAGTTAWCADEPSWNGIWNGMSVEKAVCRAIYVHAHAPSLIPMITTGTGVLSAIRSSIALFRITTRRTSWLTRQRGPISAAWAQGCGETPSARTDSPVAVIEGDRTEDFERAITKAKCNHASFALYYKITSNLRTCRLPGGLYNLDDGGNGDGTAMYVNKETGLVMPSIRMMCWHIAQQKVEKLLMTARP
jgi:hypothetical protein